LLQEELTNIIVVGSVDLDSSQLSFSKRNNSLDIDVLAPGNDIQYISNLYNSWTFGSSTLFAVPAVAGLAACFLFSNPKLQVKGSVAQKVKQYIVNLAWLYNSRPLALWNSENSTVISCNRETVLQNRQDVAACSANLPPVSISDLFLQPSSSTVTTSLTTNLIFTTAIYFLQLSSTSKLLLSTGSVISNRTTYSALLPSTQSTQSIQSTQLLLLSRVSILILSSNSSIPASSSTILLISTATIYFSQLLLLFLPKLLSIYSIISTTVPISTSKLLLPVSVIISSTAVQSSTSLPPLPKTTSTSTLLLLSNQISIFYSSGCNNTTCYTI
jgi:hypothetical protein